MFRQAIEKYEATKPLVNKLFKELRSRGYIALQNHLCCGGCAGSDIADRAEKLADEGTRVTGAVYYHSQTKARYKEIGQLTLYYGELDTRKHGTIGKSTKEVGDEVAALCKELGLAIEWDGSPAQTITVIGVIDRTSERMTQAATFASECGV